MQTMAAKVVADFFKTFLQRELGLCHDIDKNGKASNARLVAKECGVLTGFLLKT